MPCAFRQGKYHHCVLEELKDTPKVRHLLSPLPYQCFFLSPCHEALFKFMGIQVSGNNVSVYYMYWFYRPQITKKGAKMY